MAAVALAAPAVVMLVCGYLLGRICARSRSRRLRTDLAAARWLAEHDQLTGLLNRAGAEHHYRTETAAGRALTAVLIDLDGFKAVNDTWGHHIGDAELGAVADRLAAACVPLGAVATRLAGDEFLLLIPDTDPDAVQEVVQAVLTRLGAPMTLVVVDDLPVSITPRASAGIALPEGNGAWAPLLRCADIALYQAKTVRGRAVLYTPGMQQPSRHDVRGPDVGGLDVRGPDVRGPRLRDAALASYA